MPQHVRGDVVDHLHLGMPRRVGVPACLQVEIVLITVPPPPISRVRHDLALCAGADEGVLFGRCFQHLQQTVGDGYLPHARLGFGFFDGGAVVVHGDGFVYRNAF